MQFIHQHLNIKRIRDVLLVQDLRSWTVEKFAFAVQHQGFVRYAHGIGGIVGIHDGTDAGFMRQPLHHIQY